MSHCSENWCVLMTFLWRIGQELWMQATRIALWTSHNGRIGFLTNLKPSHSSKLASYPSTVNHISRPPFLLFVLTIVYSKWKLWKLCGIEYQMLQGGCVGEGPNFKWWLYSMVWVLHLRCGYNYSAWSVKNSLIDWAKWHFSHANDLYFFTSVYYWAQTENGGPGKKVRKWGDIYRV